MVKHAGGALLQSLAIDSGPARTISSKIASSLRELMLSRGLKAGDRLPATRTLASELGVARSTVVEAFEQLAAEGLIEARVGAGSFVSRALDTERPTPPRKPGPSVAAPARLAQLMAAASEGFADRVRHQPRAFTTAMPALDAFPGAQWSRLAAKHWRGPREHVFGYGEPHGDPSLRRAVAHHLRANRGIACDPSQVFIVAGAQQGFLLIASLFVNPGDRVWFENPGAIGARNCLLAQGADLVPVAVDDDGMVVEEALARAPEFRLAFVTPSHQQPLGVKLSLERRFALLKAAEEAQAWIIEDDWDGELCFGGRPLPTLRGLDAGRRVIYVGTFSKTLFPSLRLGFIVAPAALQPAFELALESFSSGAPTSVQAIVADFIDEGLYAAHVRRMRKLYAERHAALIDAAREQLGAWLDVTPTETGLHTVALLRRGLAGAEVAAAAARHGVTVEPLSRFCIAPDDREGLALGFSGVSPAQIRAGVARLAEALCELSPPDGPTAR